MVEYNRNGHRSRIRQNYIANGTNGMSDANLLELYLSCIIPRKDVKPISYALLNKFGTLKGVFAADAKQLATVNGVGENVALVIKLHSDLFSRLGECDNAQRLAMTNVDSRLEYAQRVFAGETKEKSILLTIDNQDKISGTFIFEGYFGSKKEDKKTVIEKLLQTNSAQCVFYHFDPNSEGKLTNFDIYYATEMRDLLASVRIFIIDWIVVGNGNMESMEQSNYSSRLSM